MGSNTNSANENNPNGANDTNYTNPEAGLQSKRPGISAIRADSRSICE